MASRSTPLTDDERERLAALRSATSLADLAALTGAGADHEAYFAAKREHRDLRGRELAARDRGDGLPGTTVTVGGHEFHVHGITHADTEAERTYLREHVRAFAERGATVYCEQGIRAMYFRDFPGVCEMDDYRWAMARCRELDVDSHVADLVGPEFEGIGERVDSLSARFRAAAFSLIDGGSDVYGDEFAAALGDVASAFLTSHEGAALGDDYESFAATRRAAADPAALADLQDYYAARFLSQPVEREWLRRHDRELEIVTHARNERMADYAVYHNEDAAEVHLIVGAAHQPGIAYYLRRHRDGDRSAADFEPSG